jgi:hypothetical protein
VVWGVATAGLLLAPGSSLPGSGLPETLETALELGAHLVLFLVLAYLAGHGYGGYGGSVGPLEPAGSKELAGLTDPVGRRSRVFAAVLAYCVLLEILQIAVPGREFEFVDIAAGWFGAVLGSSKRG